MSTFFGSWQRKVGLTALTLACLLKMGWVRSIAVDDYVRIFPIPFHGMLLISKQQSIWLQVWSGRLDNELTQEPGRKRSRRSYQPERFGLDLNDYLFRTAFMGAGAVNIFQPETGKLVRLCEIGVPYWSITATLTCISVRLLFAKTRTASRNANPPLKCRPTNSISER